MSDPDSPDDLESWPVLDESFIQAATVREPGTTQSGPKPSRKSLREVKSEAKQRKRSAKRAAKPQNHYHRAQWKRPVMFMVVLAVALGSIAWFGWAYGPAGLSADQVINEAREQRQSADPWEGSRAATWPTKIDMPSPQPVGGYSKSDVAGALKATGKYLQVSMLDSDVLYRGAYRPVLATLRDDANLRSYLGDPDRDVSWTNAATRFKPNVIGPADDTIRLRGFLKPTIVDDELAVDYSFAVAYAVKELKGSTAAPQVVLVRREGTLAFIDAVSGDVGLPFPSYIAAVSDHSRCHSRWQYPAFTQVWLTPPKRSAVPYEEPTQSADLTDPNDSLRDITECFSNRGA